MPVVLSISRAIKTTFSLNYLPLTIRMFYETNPLLFVCSPINWRQAKKVYKKLFPSPDKPLVKWNSKCHRWSLGLVRWVVSSIATGDIWVSEARITQVHQIMPSRPTGCLRHGNVQCVPHWPIKPVPELSHPIRAFLNISATWQKHAIVTAGKAWL